MTGKTHKEKRDAPERWSKALEQAQHSLSVLQLAKAGAQEADSSGRNQGAAIDQIRQQLAQCAEGHLLLGFGHVWLRNVVPEPAGAQEC